MFLLYYFPKQTLSPNWKAEETPWSISLAVPTEEAISMWEEVIYLIPSHPVAGSQLHEASVCPPHAVNAVNGFKASDLKRWTKSQKAGNRLVFTKS